MLLSSVDVKDCDYLQISQFQSSTMKFAGLQMIPSDKMIRYNLMTFLFILPFRTKKLKQQMLIEKQGLQKFCDLFSKAPPSSKVFTTAVESLVVLANDLQVKCPVDIANKEAKGSSKTHVKRAIFLPSQNPLSVYTGDHSVKLHKDKRLKLDPSDSKLQRCMQVNQHYPSCLYNENCFGPPDVKFQMDNGNVFSTHKQIIKGASDVFTTMLSNHYLESTQSVIAIREVSADVFEFALHHIYGCTSFLPTEALSSSSSCCGILRCVQRKDDKLQFFLELLVFADRFLLDELRTVCEQSLIGFIDTNTVVQICNYGLRLNSPKLCTHCLSHLLSVNISEVPNHLHLFRELFLRTDRADIVKHLYQFLLSHLKQHVSL